MSQKSEPNLCTECMFDLSSPRVFIIGKIREYSYCCKCFLKLSETLAFDKNIELIKEAQCSLHNRCFDIYCDSCEQLICSKCILIHKTHEISDIDFSGVICNKILTSYREKLDTLCENAQAIRKYSEDFQCSLKQVHEETQDNNIRINERMNKFVAEAEENERKCVVNFEHSAKGYHRKVFDKITELKDEMKSMTRSMEQKLENIHFISRLKLLEKLKALNATPSLIHDPVSNVSQQKIDDFDFQKLSRDILSIFNQSFENFPRCFVCPSNMN
ncbi:hypothetical protein SteCoe_14237 [Stentor coeruleus]|uniref:B box-type domain-containing protein n=1 Tax=Stentor coeruleus TaxID=5963 RepID=A0A1R2C6N7_9CILI|nr:hypothetical protein SteCoe_14237 [Stentor coeruleus]